MNQFELFSKLHNSEEPLFIGNVWDVASARLLEANGYKALATSSAAVAHSMGYEDGENMPFDLLLEIVKRIQKSISIPFSVDLEKGYSNNINGIIQHIERLCEMGVVGINIEDSGKDGILQPTDSFAKTLYAIADHLIKKNLQLFINARTDAFLLRLPDALAETTKRAKTYEGAGASGIFVPFLTDEKHIHEVVEATKLPVNVLAVPDLPDFNKLSALGIKRVSLGSSLYNSVKKEITAKLQVINEQQSFSVLFQ